MNWFQKGKRVIVAMSGGVDSSVAAALLKKQGFEVKGVFMKLFDSRAFKNSEKRARKIAKILSVPFLVLDLRKEFRKRIINYFLDEYGKGRTPNPCVVCNKEIKFGLLLEKALRLNADYIATGHYVRIKKKGAKLLLLKAKDKNKDQSYFLWKLGQKQLKRILFPLGDYTKKQTRDLAKKFRLPVLNVPESQKICFIEKGINDFLKKHLKPKSGEIVNEKGEIIGRHQGLCFYTIGQRKGIGLSGGPFYVVKKNLKKNTLIVSKNKKELGKEYLIAREVNWISPKHSALNWKAGATGQAGKKSKLPIRIRVKMRYRQKPVLAIVKPIGKKIKVIFNKPQQAITPGQSAVFYKEEELLGGGVIC